MTRTDDEIRAIVKASAEAAAQATVEQMFIKLGVDISKPTEVQADFKHLRDWRQSVEAVKRQGVLTAVGAITLGLLGLIWLALQNR